MLYSLTLTYFQGQTSNVKISKAVKASANLQEVTFIDFNICHRIASLRMMYLTWFVMVKHFKYQYLENGESQRKCGQHNICRFQYLPSNGIIENLILFDLDIAACEFKCSDLLTYQSSVCVRCSLLRAPLSMREPLVKNAHKQATVTTSLIAFENGIAHWFRYL